MLSKKHQSVGFKVIEGIVEKLAMWRGNSNKRSQFYSNEYFCPLLNRHGVKSVICRGLTWAHTVQTVQWMHPSVPWELEQLCWCGLEPGQLQIPELPHWVMPVHIRDFGLSQTNLGFKTAFPWSEKGYSVPWFGLCQQDWILHKRGLRRELDVT